MPHTDLARSPGTRRGRLFCGSALAGVVSIIGQAGAATVTVSLSADAGTTASPGTSLPYEIHIAIGNAGTPADNQGLCELVLKLTSDLGVAQTPIQSFAGSVGSGFNGVTPQFGVPNGSEGVDGIAAAQACVVTADTALGVGFPGQTLVARGALQMPETPGLYTVQIEPVQINLIAADGSGAVSPDTSAGGSLAVMVTTTGGADDGDTDGVPGGDDDVGTDGTGGDDGAGTGGDDDGAGPGGGDDVGTDGGSDDPDDDGTGSNDVAGSGSTPSLCAAGIVCPMLLGAFGLVALRLASRRGQRPGRHY
ncbi:MAG: hypothetical protein GY778_12250 [bacterium]|nr:hypothetical protein [bacterium]